MMASSGPKLPAMQNAKRKRLRWDRIGLVGGVVLLASLGIAAMVPDGEGFEDSESEGRKAAVLASPEDGGLLSPVSAEVEDPASAAGPSKDAAPKAPKAPKTTKAEAPAQLQSASIGPEPTGPLPRQGVAPCSCSKRTMKLARNPYTRHQQRARTLPGSFFVKNESELQAGFKRGDLVRVPSVGRGYHLDRLTHSEPFLLPSAMKTLERMANRFADAMEGTADEGVSIRITSLTRTQSQQSRLRRRNANAFNGQSTHNYGASFDVAFIDRPNSKVGCGGPSWALQTILQEMQEQGEILVIPEGNCMHITPLNP